MAISDLKSIVPPPAALIRDDSEALWTRIQSDLGIRFPNDFRDYAETFGSGYFYSTYLKIIDPLHAAYSKCVARSLEQLVAMKEMYGDDFHFDVHPVKDGLFPWGHDESGHSYCWHTKGKPENWPIVLVAHEGAYKVLKMDMTSFLSKMMQNKIEWLQLGPFDKAQAIFTPLATAVPDTKKRKRK